MGFDLNSEADIAEIGAVTAGFLGFVAGRVMRAVRHRQEERDAREEMKRTVDTLVADMSTVKVSLEDLTEKIGRLSPNGRDTDNLGDLVARMAEKMGVLGPKDHL